MRRVPPFYILNITSYILHFKFYLLVLRAWCIQDEIVQALVTRKGGVKVQT